MIFSEAEKTLLIKNTKQIFNFLSTEISPKLNNSIFYDFEDNPQLHKIRLRVYPGGIGEIAIFRTAINSTVYKLGSEYDSKYTQDHSGVDFYKSYDEMYHLIKNWKDIKEFFLNRLEEMDNERELIKNFTV